METRGESDQGRIVKLELITLTIKLENVGRKLGVGVVKKESWQEEYYYQF
jgi:hypothetical protein